MAEAKRKKDISATPTSQCDSEENNTSFMPQGGGSAERLATLSRSLAHAMIADTPPIELRVDAPEGTISSALAVNIGLLVTEQLVDQRGQVCVPAQCGGRSGPHHLRTCRVLAGS